MLIARDDVVGGNRRRGLVERSVAQLVGVRGCAFSLAEPGGAHQGPRARSPVAQHESGLLHGSSAELPACSLVSGLEFISFPGSRRYIATVMLPPKGGDVERNRRWRPAE